MMHGTNRHGFTMIEMVAALGMLGALTAVSLTFLHATRVQQRGLRRQQVALTEAANAMERLSALAIDDLAAGAESVALSPVAARELPNGAIGAAVENVDAPLAGQCVRVTVSWVETVGQPARKVELQTWRYGQ
jgi:prepilin-type N-terminal cleavage/methylation domain-containing protein